MRGWGAPLVVAFAMTLFNGSRASAAEAVLTARQQAGKLLFDATCNYCHNAKGWATERLKLRVGDAQAVLAERSNLSRDYIRHVIRHGLVNMPAYTPTDLTEEQLQQVADYLTRKNKG